MEAIVIRALHAFMLKILTPDTFLAISVCFFAVLNWAKLRRHEKKLGAMCTQEQLQEQFQRVEKQFLIDSCHKLALRDVKIKELERIVAAISTTVVVNRNESN